MKNNQTRQTKPYGARGAKFGENHNQPTKTGKIPDLMAKCSERSKVIASRKAVTSRDAKASVPIQEEIIHIKNWLQKWVIDNPYVGMGWGALMEKELWCCNSIPENQLQNGGKEE